jgi:hypothetical protein
MSAIKIDAAFPKFTYLQTARFRIVEPVGVSQLNPCVLESGNQSSFVSTSIIDALILYMIDQRNLVVSAFESSSVTFKLAETSPPGAEGHLDQLKHDRHRIWERLWVFTATNCAPRRQHNDTFSQVTVRGPLGARGPSHRNPRQRLPLLEDVNNSPPRRISPSVVLLPSKLGWVLSGNQVFRSK